MKITLDIPDSYHEFCKWCVANKVATIDQLVIANGKLCEEKTGHWIDDYAGEVDAEFGRHRYRCSCCGKRANHFIGGLEDWWDIDAPDFCPNCGADMRGKE